MATFDGNIVVNISLDSAPVTEQNFSTVLIAGTTMSAAFTERIRRYANAADAEADTTLSAGLVERLKIAFQQALVPAEVAVGRVSEMTKDVWNVAPSASGAAGDTITVTILGEDFVFTSTGVENTTQITTALIGLIGASSLPVTTTDNGADFDVTGTNDGQLLEVTTAVTGTAGVAETHTTTAVTMGDELAAILAEDAGWYSVVLESRASWDILSAAGFVEANDRLLTAQTSDSDTLDSVTTDIASQLKILAYTKTSVWYYSDLLDFLDVALAANRSVVNPDNKATTWAYVTLVGVAADDANITATQRGNLLSKNANCYLTAKGVGATSNAKVASGEWIDVIIAADWIRARLAEDATQMLLNYSARGEKVPYTDQGINAFASLIETRISQGVSAGHFIADTETVTAPKLVDIPVSERRARRLTIGFSVQPAGAIQFVTINGYITLSA